jgi:hypothetical protein
MSGAVKKARELTWDDTMRMVGVLGDGSDLASRMMVAKSITHAGDSVVVRGTDGAEVSIYPDAYVVVDSPHGGSYGPVE